MVVDGWPIRTGNGEKPLLLVDGMRGGRKRRRKVSAMEADVEMVKGSADGVDGAWRPAGRMNVKDEERAGRWDDVNEAGCELCRDFRTGRHSRLKDQPELNMPRLTIKFKRRQMIEPQPESSIVEQFCLIVR